MTELATAYSVSRYSGEAFHGAIRILTYDVSGQVYVRPRTDRSENRSGEIVGDSEFDPLPREPVVPSNRWPLRNVPLPERNGLLSVADAGPLQSPYRHKNGLFMIARCDCGRETFVKIRDWLSPERTPKSCRKCFFGGKAGARKNNGKKPVFPVKTG